MEELILIAVFAILALVAMGQCAHHSSRRHVRHYVRPTEQGAADAGGPWKHAIVTADKPDEPVQAETSDRDPHPK